MTHGWLFVLAERGQQATSLKMVAGQERLYQTLYLPLGWGSMFGPGLLMKMIGSVDWASIGFSFRLVD